MGTIPLLYGPLKVCLNLTAAIDTTVAPDPSVALALPWFTLGTNANLGYSSDGVRLEVAESLTDIFTDGTTMAVDTRRTEESILLTATLTEDSIDLSMFQMAFNNNTVTSVTASPTVEGSRTMDLYQGPHVQKFQFVARAMSRSRRRPGRPVCRAVLDSDGTLGRQHLLCFRQGRSAHGGGVFHGPVP